MSIISPRKTKKTEKLPKKQQEVPEEISEPLAPSDDVILALDIGTEFVKAVIGKPSRNPEKDGTIRVIGVGRARQKTANMYAGAIADIGAVTNVCEKALTEAESQAGVRAKIAVVGIAGELIKGNTSTVRYRRKNGNKPLSEAEMNLIIKRVQDKAGEKARREVALETNNPDVEVRLINSAIVSLTIDGYKISNPIGFKGSDLQIQFYTAYAPLVHISAIEKVCAELSLDLLAVAVEPFAVCRACLGDDIDSNLSAIVMDIGGGTTDIAVVDDGGVEGTKMFSIGGRSFTHQIATSLGVDYVTAENLKLHPEKAPSKKASEKLELAIEKNMAVWLSGVQLALEDFPLIEVFPNKILLCGGGAGLAELQETLAIEDWYEELPFSRRPVIHLVDVDDIPGIIDETDRELDHSFVTAFGLLRVALDTLSGAPEGHSLRDRIMKLLQN